MFIVLFHFYSNKPNPVYQEIAANLRKLGHQVWVGEPNSEMDLIWRDGENIVGSLPGPAAAENWLYKVPVARGFAVRWQYFRFMLRVRRFLRKLTPEIVQVNPVLFAWCLPLLMPDKIKFILDIRQINEEVDFGVAARLREKTVIASMKQNAKLFYDHTCFCHEGAARRILGKNWTEKGSVVPVGVDEQFISFEYCQEKKDDSPAVIKFIYVGTLTCIRNLERVLEAVKILHQQTDRFQLDFVGPDACQGKYGSLVETFGIGAVTAVKPAVPYHQVPALLAQYDVGVAYVPDRPTWHYQPTIKILEYRAMGMPILSTRVQSHLGIVEDGVNGLLCTDQPDDIAAKLSLFISQPELLNTLRQNARRMRQGKSWFTIAQMYDDLVYQRVDQRGASSIT